MVRVLLEMVTVKVADNSLTSLENVSSCAKITFKCNTNNLRYVKIISQIKREGELRAGRPFLSGNMMSGWATRRRL